MSTYRNILYLKYLITSCFRYDLEVRRYIFVRPRIFYLEKRIA